MQQLGSLASLCVNENYFTFRGKNYKTTKRVAMGNPLSPMLNELFMSHIEEEIAKKEMMPKVWYRYVDDVIAVVQTGKIPKILNTTIKINYKM